MSGEQVDARSNAQFFFDVGYGACWADAFIAGGEKPPFPMTDAGVERAWEIAGEAHDDPAEFDRRKAAANSHDALVKVLEDARRWITSYVPREIRGNVIAKIDAALSLTKDGQL